MSIENQLGSVVSKLRYVKTELETMEQEFRIKHSELTDEIERLETELLSVRQQIARPGE